MTNIAQLGFEIDSSPLAQAGRAAEKAAAQIGQVGDAADKAGKQASTAGKQIGQDLGGGLGNTGKQADGAVGALGRVGGALQGIGKIGRNVAGEIGNLSQAFGIATGSAGGVALNGVLRGATGGLDALGGMLGKFSPLAGMAATGVGTLATAFVGAQAALASVQDKWASYEGQLKSTLGSTGAARAAIKDLYDTAQGTGISFDSTISSFNRLARNANDLGASNREILTLSTTIQQLGVVSGASAGEIGSGMLQLSQALASGKLNGDELRSIMENMPALAKAIADGLGVSVGQLRSMGAAGELTGDKVFRAILGNADKVNEQFKDMPDTTERAFQRVSDSWSRMLGKMGEAANSSGFVQSLLNATNGLIKSMTFADRTPEQEMARLQNLRTQQAKMYGADREGTNANQRLREIDAQIAKLKQDVEDGRKSLEMEAYRPAIAAFGRGATTAKEAKTLSTDQNELAEQIRTIEGALIAAGQRGTASVLPPDQQPNSKAVEGMESGLISLKQKLEDTAGALGKLQQSTQDYRDAVARGGTGGGVDIVSKAIETARQMRAQGVGATADTTIGAVIDDRVARAGEEVRGLERQAAAQKNLVATVGATRDAVREAEISQAAYDYRIKTFGSITTPAVEKAVARYTAALRQNKAAADALGDARAFQGIADQVEVLQAGAKAAAAGAYAMREAEARARSAQADRNTPGIGAQQNRLFDLQEERQAQQQIDQILRQAAATRRAAAAKDAAEERQVSLQAKIEDAQRGVAPGKRRDLGAAMLEEEEAGVTKQLADQGRELDQQILSMQQSMNLVHFQNADLAEQEAILAKTNELRKQGVDVDNDARAIEVIAKAGRAARRRFEVDNTRSLAEQARTLEEQIGYQGDQLKLVQLYGEELAVQQAVLAKRNQLLKQGVDLQSPDAQRVLKLTADEARGNFNLDRQQKDADAWRAIWDDGAKGVTGSITSAFMATFDKSKKAGEEFRKALSSTFSNMAQDIMTQALKPLEEALAALLKQGGSWLANWMGGGGGGGYSPSGIEGSPSFIGPMPQAMGGAYLAGGVHAFAAGGAFTNSVVSSPTLFKFAKGGATRLGVMGEAGEEAIMPLRRGPDGRLGVSAAGAGSGGGNTFQILISVDASSGATTTQSNGNDQDNQGRALGEMISRAVKDEIVQQLRPGGALARR